MTDFSALATPLTEVVKRSVGFKLGDKQDRAFNLITEGYIPLLH